MIKYDIPEKDIIEKNLNQIEGRKVEIVTPQKGNKLKFVEMAEKNADILLKNRTQKQLDILNELKEKLGLEKFPFRIESYDISNISGQSMVSAMVVAEKGKIKRNLSRRFDLSNMHGQNDVLAMKETLTKRIEHNLQGKTGLGDFPDIIIADGGKGQINGIKSVLKMYPETENIKVFGLIKDDKHSTKALITNKGEEIHLTKETMDFCTRLQDEVHNTAIEYHRKKRDKKLIQSELDNIKGIGEKRKQQLYKKFNTIENMKNASIEELMEVRGITREIAEEIRGI